MSKGWVGVDLDGTWVTTVEWLGELHVGEAIPEMTARVKRILKSGIEVRVFTARVCKSPDKNRAPREQIVKAIQDFTEQEVGKRLAVTNEKDYDMIMLLDDRAVHIKEDTGQPCCKFCKALIGE